MYSQNVQYVGPTVDVPFDATVVEVLSFSKGGERMTIFEDYKPHPSYQTVEPTKNRRDLLTSPFLWFRTDKTQFSRDYEDLVHSVCTSPSPGFGCVPFPRWGPAQLEYGFGEMSSREGWSFV